MSYWFFRKGNALYPADDRAERYMRKMFEGEASQIEIERSRSYKWHKMYVAICIEIGQNCDPERDWMSIDNELRVRAGHYDKLIVNGYKVLVPKRIAFDKLTADQWQELWPRLDQAMRDGFEFDHTAGNFA